MVGLGAIGRLVVAAALKHPELEVVGAADPAHAGERLQELVAGAPDRAIEATSASLYREARGGVAFLCTSSTLQEVAPEILAAVRAGCHVISSCEELSNAGFVDPDLAAELDGAAKKSGVSILGTGVNPGFVLDRLVVTVGAVVGEIRHVEAIRRAAIGPRGLERIGAGLDPGAFERLVEEGRIGHVGLTESCALVADGLFLDVDEVEEQIDPIVAEEAIALGELRIPAGAVRGVKQVAQGLGEGREVIRLSLEAAVGLVDPGDRIRIDADPPVVLEIPGGIQGDRATAWALVNAAPRVAASDPGILDVLDLPAGR